MEELMNKLQYMNDMENGDLLENERKEIVNQLYQKIERSYEPNGK